MTDGDKEARRAVRDYLKALEANKPRRGRKRTPETIGKRLAAIDEEAGAASALKKLELAQERINLQVELDNLGNTVDLSALEADFVTHAKDYGAQKSISYAAWREVGVSSATLKAAGITRGS